MIKAEPGLITRLFYFVKTPDHKEVKIIFDFHQL